MHFKTQLARLAVAGAVVATPLIALPASASAPTNTDACYGASCNGRRPEGVCDSDAQTVRAMSTKQGMLELRYSAKCAANWGRYTPYRRTVLTLTASKLTPITRITVWNPGEKSYGGLEVPLDPRDSVWSPMTDGTKKACTGVEEINVVFGSDAPNGWASGQAGDQDSLGWTWGPCY